MMNQYFYKEILEEYRVYYDGDSVGSIVKDSTDVWYFESSSEKIYAPVLHDIEQKILQLNGKKECNHMLGILYSESIFVSNFLEQIDENIRRQDIYEKAKILKGKKLTDIQIIKRRGEWFDFCPYCGQQIQATVIYNQLRKLSI